MQLYIAGGCGDQGRNCFYVEGDRHAFLVDAGTSTDGLDRLPDIGAGEVRRAEYLFITHSHRDHTGAIEQFEKMGFDGPVIMSQQAYRQMRYQPANTMILDSTAPELTLEPDFELTWGRTGHCAGAVWYHMLVEGKRLFFSGDYRENDTFYRCDMARGLTADVAVIDAAYSRKDRAPAMRQAVMDAVAAALSSGGPLLLPVPTYGRGLSIAMLVYKTYGDRYPIYLSPKLYQQWKLLGHWDYFVHPDILDIPYSVFREWDGESIAAEGIYFLTDAQLSRAEDRYLVDSHPELHVLMTGTLHGYGGAKGYYESGRAAFALWPNHLTWQEMEDLQKENHFGVVVPFHNAQVPAESDTVVF